jgi:hypothetical protein
MPNGPSQPGSESWLESWILTSLQDLQRSLGDAIGTVRTGQEAINRRLDDLRTEVHGRLERLEAHVASEPEPPQPALLELAKEVARSLPWRHIIILGLLAGLGLLGHLSPEELKRLVLGALGG